MKREEIIATVRDVVAEAIENGMSLSEVHDAVSQGAQLLSVNEVKRNRTAASRRRNRPQLPELDLRDPDDKLNEPLAEEFATLLERFFYTSIRQHAKSEAERPTVAYRLALGAVEAANRCVHQAAFEGESSLPADEIDSAALNLFLVIAEVGEELDSRQ